MFWALPNRNVTYIRESNSRRRPRCGKNLISRPSCSNAVSSCGVDAEGPAEVSPKSHLEYRLNGLSPKGGISFATPPPWPLQTSNPWFRLKHRVEEGGGGIEFWRCDVGGQCMREEAIGQLMFLRRWKGCCSEGWTCCWEAGPFVLYMTI
jgi:hypothetical protein